MSPKDTLKNIPPLIFIAIAFCLGIISSYIINLSQIAILILAFIFLTLSFVFARKITPFFFLFLIFIFLTGASHLKNQDILYGNHISKIIPYIKEDVRLEGKVVNEPEITNKSVSFIFNAQHIIIKGKEERISGKILVRSKPKDNISYGDILYVTGHLYAPPRFLIRENFNYRDYLKRKGIRVLCNARHTELVKKTIGNPIIYLSLELKHKLEKIIENNLSAYEASVLSAMLLGKRKEVPAKLQEAFVHTGTAHILAISGLHVGIVIFILLFFLKFMRIKRRPRFILVILALVFYCFLTGARPSVVRATIMGAVVLLGLVIQREVNIYNSLALSCLVILGFNPYQIFDVGFQLSFASVISIVYIFPKLKLKLPKDFFSNRFLRFLSNGIIVSACAWIGIFPLIAYYFNIISPITILANLIVVPLMSLAVILGFCLLFFGLISNYLALVFSFGLSLCLFILIKAVFFLSNLVFAYFIIPQISLIYILLYYFSFPVVAIWLKFKYNKANGFI